MIVKTRIIDSKIKTSELKYAKAGDAGIDLAATSKYYDEYGNVCYGTNRAFEIPQGYVGLIFPRSSNSKMELSLSNSVAVIDSGFRGEVVLKFKRNIRLVGLASSLLSWFGLKRLTNSFNVMSLGTSREYKVGDRVGQLIIMPYPKIEFQEVEQLSSSERGEGGFGSTGN